MSVGSHSVYKKHNRLHWDMQQSLLHTLADKYRKSKQAMVHRYHPLIETPDGSRRCLRVTKESQGGKKPVIATFVGIALKHQQQAILSDRRPLRHARM